MTERAPYKEKFVKFIPYLNDIDITTRAYLKRVELIYTLCSDICPEEIEDIFIEDYIKEDGTREFDDITFFSKRYCVSAHSFLSKINLAISPITKRITFWGVTAQDFDFKESSERSRLNVYIKTVQGADGDFKATRGNCTYLQAIINKYIKPNLIT